MKFPLNRFMVLSVIVVTGLVGVLCFRQLRRPTTLSKSEAILQAERFIVANGYTDLPPDRSRLVPEPVVFSSSLDEELEMRNDTLERRADGAAGGEDGWVVFFRYKGRTTGYRRAVVMDAKGGHVHIMHQDAW